MRDIKVRYKQTFIGFAWYVLQPLGYMLIFTFVFSFVFARGQGLPYSLFALSGIVLWLFFARAVSNGATSFHSFQNILDKIYFPRLAAPVSIVLSAFLDLVVGGVLLAFLMVVFQVPITWKILLLPLFLIGTMLLSMGLAIFFGSLDVRYRDVRHALTFIMQLWMFSTPIMYPIDIVPERFRDIYALNPMVGYMQGYRWSLFADSPFPDPKHLAFSAIATVIALFFAVYVFRRTEGTLVDTL